MDSEHNLPTPELQKTPETQISEPGVGEVIPVKNPEEYNQPMPGERVSSANDAVAQAVVSTNAVPLNPLPAQSDDDTSDDTTIADDGDVIEKEWVDKAKNIVARTHGDPHAKSSQLTFLKKDYMHKRYGKLIKVPDDQKMSP